MADDVFQVVTFSGGGRPIVLFDLERVNNDIAGDVWKQRDSFTVTPGEVQDVNAQGPRRWSGQRAVASKGGNGTIGARWTVTGDTPDEAIANAEAFVEQMRRPLPGRYIKWKPVGTAFPVYYEIRGNGTWKPDYSKIVFEQNYSISVDASWPVAPLAELDPMDIYDDFGIPADAELLYANLNPNPRADQGNATGYAGNNATISVVAGAGGYGANVFRATQTVAGGGAGQFRTIGAPSQQTVVPGRTYSFRVKVVAISPLRNMVQIIEWRDSTGAVITTSSGPSVNTLGERILTAVAPANAVYAFIDLYSGSGAIGNTADSDGWLFSEGAPAYFDGDSHASRWTGDRFTSTSELYAETTLDDYTFETGAGTLIVNAGAALGTNTSAKEFYHSARGYRYADFQLTVKFRTGASVASHRIDLGKRVRTNLKLLLVNNISSNLTNRKVVDGTLTLLGSGAGVALVANTDYWLRFRCAGNEMTSELWTTQPTPTVAPTHSISYTLTAAEAALLGEGIGGEPYINFTPGGTDWRLEEVTVEPYTYRNRTLPEVLRLPGVPGSEGTPALLDLELTTSGPGGVTPTWGLFGWWRRPEVFSYVWNGHFEDNIAGWFISGLSFNNAPTSFSRGTSTPGKFGIATGDVVSPATANTGPEFRIYGEIRKGVTYTARAWVRSAAAVDAATIVLGIPSVSTNTGVSVNLSSTWQELTVAYTATADADLLVVALRHVPATAVSWQIDGVGVYEGTVAPTTDTQTEGRGGLPPVGIIPAESADTAAEGFGSWAITTDANYRRGQGLKLTGISGVSTSTAAWMIDPSLGEQDDFTEYELDVEVYGRLELSSTLVTPKAILSAVPKDSVQFGAARYSNEWGSSGLLLTKPSSGTLFRRVRLGTVTLYVDPRYPTRWYLKLQITTAVGSTGTVGLDELELVPVDARVMTGPTAVAFDSSYPRLTNNSGGEVTRLFRSNGSGFTRRPGTKDGLFPDIGVSRELELPGGGDVEALIALSSLVPNDPTSDATSEAEDITGTVHFAVTPRVHLARGV